MEDVDIPDAWLRPLHRAEYAFTILYNPALMATKTSILIFYLRLARNTQKLLRIASYVTLAIVNVAGIILTFLNAFQCTPASAAYSKNPSESGNCMSIVTIYLCSAPINVITDLAILILPIPVLTGMRLPQRQKTVLVFTFALGIFVTVVDVIRIYYLQQAADVQTLIQSRIGVGGDFSFNASMALMWSAVEVNVGIICACIPTLKPLIQRVLPVLIMDRRRSASDKDPTTGLESHAARNVKSEPSHQMSSISGHAPSIRPLPLPRQAGNLEEEMDTMDFVTSTGVEPETGQANTTRTYVTEQSVYFGFIDMRRPKSMLKTKGTEAFKYCAVVATLFFLWGFSYGLLNTLNMEISEIADESTTQTLSLTAAYFGGYLIGPLTIGQWILRHGGFKACFISGLCIYGTGTLMFWPSAVLLSFPGFLISDFVVGLGLSTIEIAANPFIALCGPSQHAEYRLLLAQGIQALGALLSQLLAQKVLFPNVVQRQTLIDVQWTYLAITLFTGMLALFFYYMPLPEASDTDLQLQSDDLGIYLTTPSILTPRVPLIYLTLALAVFAQFIYVAIQECVSAYFGPLLTMLSTPNTPTPLNLTVDDYDLLSHTTFALSRFICAPLCLIFPPRILLLATFIGGIIFTALTAALHINVNAVSGLALMVFFFEGPVWPLIFAIALRGMGKRTKLACAFLTASAGGGGPFPFVMWAVQQASHKTIQYSFYVVVALWVSGIIFPVYLNLVAGARYQVDPSKSSSLSDDGQLRHGRGPADERPETRTNRLSNGVRNIMNQLGGGTSNSGKHSQNIGLPGVEHRESGSDDGNREFRVVER